MNESMDEAVVYAKKYLEDLLSFFGLNTDVHASDDEEVIQLNVPSTHLNGFLIGQRGDNVRSLQYLTSTALKNQNFAHTRVNVDVADYKKQRAEKLAEKAKEWIEQVRSTGDSYVANLNAADRRIVHGVAAEYDDIQTFSEGEGRERHLIIAQKSS